MITAQPLSQAREALMTLTEQNNVLVGQLKEQGRKICELEREVQKQSTSAAQAEHALRAARMEIEALRGQIPDSATQNAFEALQQFLAAPCDVHPALRIAA